MATTLPGFGPGVFSWFAGLEADNSRDYFTATRELYDRDVREALEALLDELSASFGGAPKVFRQHRDLRFSADRTPYKTRTYGVLADVPGTAAGLYAELSARGLYAGRGYYRLAPDQLERYRTAVAGEADGPALARAAAAVQTAGLAVEGHGLRTAPRGYPRDHPRIALLRRKSLFAGARLSGGDDGIAGDAALAHVGDTWRAARPLVAWLDTHVGPSTLR